MCLSFCLFPCVFICCFQFYSPHMSEIILHRLIFSRSIHVVTSGSISSVLMVEWYSFVDMPLIFSTQSSVKGHFSCLHILATVNNAAMDIEAHMSLRINGFEFFRWIPRKGIAGSYGNSLLNFLRSFHTVFHSSCTRLHPHQTGGRGGSTQCNIQMIYHGNIPLKPVSSP